MRISIALLLLFSISGCKDDVLLNNTPYFECNKALGLTIVTAHDRIIGKWKWERRVCCGLMASGQKPYEDKDSFAGQVVEFRADGTGEILRGTNRKSFHWDLKLNPAAEDTFDWVQDLSAGKVVPDETMYGYILFCDDQLIFLNTPVDGADNFYLKF
jgi:hypothetical protein